MLNCFPGQLSDNMQMPADVLETVESQVTELRKIALRRTVLIVCDDMWDNVLTAFDCIDSATPSKILVCVFVTQTAKISPQAAIALVGDNSREGRSHERNRG